MNKNRRTSNINNIVTYDILKNVTIPASLTVKGLMLAGFVKSDANGLFSVDATIYQAALPSQLGNNGKYLTTDGTSLSWGNIPAFISLSAIGSTPNASAATLTGSVLNLEPASASFGGVVTTGSQTLAGDKTLTGITSFDKPLNIKYNSAFNIPVGYTSIGADSGGIVLKPSASIHAYLSFSSMTAARNYNFPNASGTLSLTSDLSNYVPYSNATTNVNLGNKYLSVFGNTNTAYLSVGNAGASMKYSQSQITMNDNQFGGSLTIFLRPSGLITGIDRTITFPNANGEVALVGGAGVGTVTSVSALTIGTTGTDVSSSVVNSTTTPVITLNIPDASATARGLVTTNTQIFAGSKTFNSTVDVVSNLSTTGILTADKTSTGLTGSTNSYGTSIVIRPTVNSGITWGSGNVFINQQGIFQPIFSGSATFQSSNYVSQELKINRITFANAASEITMTQASGGIRVYSNAVTHNYIDGTNNGTISHFANIAMYGDYAASTAKFTFTNRYGLLINDFQEFAQGHTYINRWAIYQDGASDNNYFKGKVVIGSTNTVGASPLNVKGLPTSASGLSTGDIWSNGGVLTVV